MISPDVRDALEIQGSVARPIDTVTYALDDVVYRNECELLATVSLPKIGISVCSYYSCWSTDLGDRKSLREGPLYVRSDHSSTGL